MMRVDEQQRAYLLNHHVLNDAQLTLTEQAQQLQGGSLLDNSVKLGFLTREQASFYQGQQLGLSYLSLNQLVPDPEALTLFEPVLLRKWQAAPIKLQQQNLTLGVVNPDDLWVQDQIEHYCTARLPSFQLNWVLINRDELADFLARSYQYQRAIPALIDEALELSPQQASLNDQDDFRHPIVRLVDSLLTEAVRQSASDLHFEPEQAFVQLRYRIDGLLVLQHYIPKVLWLPILARIKILSGLDVTEQRRPQDGRFAMMLLGKAIDFRVSSLPGSQGENLVLRVLDQQKSVLDLTALGLDAPREQALRRWLAQPAGVILVVGPTGSGKTTSLYAMLASLNQPGVNIMTLEDPIEYRLIGLRQTQVNSEFGVSFQQGLRAILRQDPDIILVGEIRDAETARLAFQAAMTGHLVLSTLHCDRASQARYRLIDLGVSETVMNECLVGVMAQRLVRCLVAEQASQSDPVESRQYAGRQVLIEMVSRWPADQQIGDFYDHGAQLVANQRTDQAELQRVVGVGHA
ncbi:GspE/PulE family protein [Thiomicrospira sp. ALE5]|uniref:GspE/PulE family protein n=1 Tax=Thiomicrospira sp. ALE5 TaxID=748650 RepID=UPI0008F32296|nr:GspE/PulE family protein [Thiomicrospira sp. ALE5]SFR52286.1 type IV pilus assembly protein PilB [Thiomicrospira sp. ALE5]